MQSISEQEGVAYALNNLEELRQVHVWNQCIHFSLYKQLKLSIVDIRQLNDDAIPLVALSSYKVN